MGSIYESIVGKYILPNSHFQFLDDGNIRTAAFNGDMIALPVFLGISACYEFAHYLKDKKHIRLLMVAVFMIGLFVTHSRGPLVGTCLGLAIIYLLDSKRRARHKGINKKIIVRIFAIAALGALAFFVIVYSPILDNTPLAYFAARVRTIFVWDNSNGDHSNATRVYLWRYFWNMFLHNFMFGIGIGSTGTDLAVTIGSTESGLIKRLVELGFGGQ